MPLNFLKKKIFDKYTYLPLLDLIYRNVYQLSIYNYYYTQKRHQIIMDKAVHISCKHYQHGFVVTIDGWQWFITSLVFFFCHWEFNKKTSSML